MDRRGRVEAALALERPDRPPAGWWGHTFQEEWSPPRLAEATIARAESYGWDFVKLQPRATCFAEAFGSQYKPSGTSVDPPILLAQAVRMLEDWSWLPKADAMTPQFSDQVECLAQVVAGLGPSTPVIQTVFSPLTVAGYLIGNQKGRVVRELRKYPYALADALARIADGLADFAAASVARGAAGIFFAISSYASDEMMNWYEYEEMVLPHDLAVLDSLPEEAWFNVGHVCGSRIHPEIMTRLPVHALSWSAEPGNPSLAEGQKLSGKAVMGGVGHKTPMVYGSPHEVRAQAEAALAATGGYGHLLAPGCSVPPEAPEANLRAFPAGGPR